LRRFSALTILIFALPLWAAEFGVFSPEKQVFDFRARPMGERTAHFASGQTCDVYLRKARQSDPISKELLETVLGEGGQVIEHRLHMNSAVNCHGFTCQTLGVRNLPVDPWINFRDMEVLLDEYFAPTGIVYHSLNLNTFATDPRLKPNDVVLFLGEDFYSRGRGVLQHTGIVRRVNGENWVLQKLDEDMVVLTPIRGPVERYGILEVLIFRAKL
jgi:hypothetical protein